MREKQWPLDYLRGAYGATAEEIAEATGRTLAEVRKSLKGGRIRRSVISTTRNGITYYAMRYDGQTGRKLRSGPDLYRRRDRWRAVLKVGG